MLHKAHFPSPRASGQPRKSISLSIRQLRFCQHPDCSRVLFVIFLLVFLVCFLFLVFFWLAVYVVLQVRRLSMNACVLLLFNADVLVLLLLLLLFVGHGIILGANKAPDDRPS